MLPAPGHAVGGFFQQTGGFSMTRSLFTISALVLTTLLASGCDKAATETAKPKAIASRGPLVSAAQLNAIDLPVPANAPAGSTWRTIIDAKDGYRQVGLRSDTDKEDWLGVELFDCNSENAKKQIAYPPHQRGIYAACVDKPLGKIKGYDMYYEPDFDGTRTVKAGRLLIYVTGGLGGLGKVQNSDLEAFLASLDLDGLAQL
jgi:hypothetical protein